MGVDTTAERLAARQVDSGTPPIPRPQPTRDDGGSTLAAATAKAVAAVKAGAKPSGAPKRTKSFADWFAGWASDTDETDQAILATTPEQVLAWGYDAQFIRDLEKEKVRAALRIAERKRTAVAPGTLHGMTPEEILANKAASGVGILHGMTPEEIAASKASAAADAKKASDAEQQAWADKINTAMAKGEPVVNPRDETTNAEGVHNIGMRPEDVNDTDQHRRQTLGKPIIRGLPVDAGAVLGESSTTSDGSGLSEWIRQWATSQGLDVTYEDAQESAKTGDFAYMGQEEDKAGGPGYMRDVFVFMDDAKAAVTSLPSEVIADYQSRLGLTVTGIVDSDLQGLWDEAVKTSQRYARNGRKLEVKFMFDTLVETAIAQGGLGGGGGGGGGSKVPTTDSDYYFAMMQVLGDISGVKQ